MVSATTTSLSDALPSSERDRRSVRHEADGGAGPASRGDLAMVAFEAVLALARTSSDIRRGGVGGRLSPSQMFESPVDREHDKMQAAMKADDKAEDLKNVRDNRLDRSSIGARRAWEMGRSNDTRSGSVMDRASAAVLRADGGRGAMPLGEMAEREFLRSLSPETTVNRAERLSPPGDESTSPARWAITSTAKEGGASFTATTSPSTSHAIGGVDPVHALSRSSATSPARQIAQFLGGGRIGEVESGRAVLSASDPSSSNASRSEQKAPKPTSMERYGRAGSREPSASGANTKVDSTQRSPFDELVRSIRLQSGVRNSSARIRLHPPELGRVHVDLHVAGDKIEIDVRTETIAARDLIHDRAAQLTSALQQHGIEVDRFDVTTDLAGGEQDVAHGSHDSQAAVHRGGEDEIARDDVPLDGTNELAASDVELEFEVVGETRLDIRV